MLDVFTRRFVRSATDRSAQNPMDRRRFLRAAGLTGVGVAGISVLGAGVAAAAGPSDGAVLNFLLDLEYLEAEYYLRGVSGSGLPADMVGGSGTAGQVTGGRQVRFSSGQTRQYAAELAADNLALVRYLRKELGEARISRPAIDLGESFTTAARLAGLVQGSQTFDPFANESNFLLGAFVFEDVVVTAYKGALPLITNKTYLEAAGGILATKAQHASLVRTLVQITGGAGKAQKISDARDSLDGSSDLDQGVLDAMGNVNIVPTNDDGITFSRSAGQVLNIMYLTPTRATTGGFFPSGVNGAITTSNDNA